MTNNRILFLGASGFQIPVINQAKEMGLYVGVVDYNNKAPAILYADKYYECSIKDEEAVLDIARSFKADAICVGVCDSAMNTAAFVCEKLNLHGTSRNVAANVTDKFRMIELFEKNGVAHPDYQLIKKEELLTAELMIEYPLVTKPIDAAGSKGIHIVRDKSGIDDALMDSSKCGYSGDVIVEEMMEGPEVSVELIVQDGVPFVAQVTDKLTTGEPFFIEVGHTQPSQLKREELEKIKKLACDAALAVGLLNSIAHAEVMLTKKGPKMVEIAGRLGGGGTAEQLIKLSGGYNLPEATINFSFGKKYEMPSRTESKSSAVRFIISKEGVVKSIRGVEKAREIRGVHEVNLMFQVGDVFTDAKDNSGRIGYVIASAETQEEAVSICYKALDLINVEVERA